VGRSLSRAIALGEVQGQQVQVGGALAQGRQAQGDHVQAVVQIFPEPPFPDLGDQIAVGEGDDAHIHGDGPATAQAVDGALLDGPQQFAWRGRGSSPISSTPGCPIGLLEAPT